MISTVGVFTDARAAQAVRNQLGREGISEDRQILLRPGASEEELEHVPVTTGEQPGMGKVVGGLVGSAMGIGAAAGVIAIPGVGPVTVIGMLGLALLATAAGVKVGDVIDDRLDEGLPVDELFVYEDALRKGRSIVIAIAEDDEEAERARAIMAQLGAETVDAARDQWWIGLRSAEEAAYQGAHPNGSEKVPHWNDEESTYRAGFEAALMKATRGRSYDEVKAVLRERHPEIYLRSAFRRGYERGQEYDRKMRSMNRTVI